ncbi:MAG: hypothetical protein J6K55_03985 [Clostridia bacterium]|nr:hypothetical protein [Clostridia bacterium]
MTRHNAFKWTACLLLAALSFAVFYSICASPSSDLSIHATWAAEGRFLDPLSFVRHHAHPLWHFFVNPLHRLGVELHAAASLVTACFKVLEFLTVCWLCRIITGSEIQEWKRTLCSLAVVLCGPVCLPWYNPTVFTGPGTPNTWHSPTQILTLSFALVCIVLTVRSWERCRKDGADKAFTPLQWLVLAGLLALNALAKPVFLQAFLPAAALYFLILWIRNPEHTRYFWKLIGAYLPCVGVILLQFVFYFLHPTDRTGMTVAFNWANIRDTFVCLALMQAFPLYVLLTSREKKRDTLTDLILWANAAAFLEQMFLCETGRRAADGNFAWAFMATSLLMWALTLPRFLRETQENRERRLRNAAGWALAAYHIGSGVYYIIYLLQTGATM